MICREIKCKDLDKEGEPAWCCRSGCPAVVAMNKCPKVMGKQNEEKKCGVKLDPPEGKKG